MKSSERLATFEHLDDRVFCESGNQDWKGSPCLVLVAVPAEQGAGEMVPRAGGQERGRVCKIMIADQRDHLALERFYAQQRGERSADRPLAFRSPRAPNTRAQSRSRLFFSGEFRCSGARLALGLGALRPRGRRRKAGFSILSGLGGGALLAFRSGWHQGNSPNARSLTTWPSRRRRK